MEMSERNIKPKQDTNTDTLTEQEKNKIKCTHAHTHIDTQIHTRKTKNDDAGNEEITLSIESQGRTGEI